MKRGIRNNNPANIVRGTDPWQGLREVQTDKKFCQFVSMEYGVRALVVVLRSYVTKHKLYDIRNIIRRFAPPFENKTDVYIANVKAAFYAKDYPVEPNFSAADFSGKGSESLYILCCAICQQESNYWLPRELFTTALKMLNHL